MIEKSPHYKLHFRYAFALSKLAKDTNKRESLLKESEEILKLYRNDPNFRKIFQNPLINSRKQLEIIESLFSTQSDTKINISKTMYAFLVLICKNSRLSIMEGVLNTFKYMLSHENQELEVSVTSAVKLDSEVNDQLIALLERKTKKKISLINNIDKSIIGGLILQIGSNLIDASVKNKLLRINTMIKGAI